MQSIVCVNTEIPTVEEELDYCSEGSLRDFDIVVFDPELPFFSRIDYSGGGSSLSIEGAKDFAEAAKHWTRELRDAVAGGKTVFVNMSALKEDTAAVSYTTGARNARNYSTTTVNNYCVVPSLRRIRNARGQRLLVKDPSFRGLYDAIKEIAEYRVVFEEPSILKVAFSAKDGTAVGGVMRLEGLPGALVLLPHFDFDVEGFTDLDPREGERVWTEKALSTSHALVGQLVAIDRILRGSVAQTPPPESLEGCPKPNLMQHIERRIVEIDSRIFDLGKQREAEDTRREDVAAYSHLLYETGKPLERAIEKALRLLGYSVETFRSGDLEIDHVIVGPSGVRMIGESEGKDTSAIDISKFRQLESNIGEDFERDEVETPAKGLLFGNGFRLTAPANRPQQFTDKSLTNARRLGSALVRTMDLFPVATHLLDNPDDEEFKMSCREAIERTVGTVVEFPTANDAEGSGAGKSNDGV